MTDTWAGNSTIVICGGVAHRTVENSVVTGSASGSAGASEEQQTMEQAHLAHGDTFGEHGRTLCGHMTATASKTAKSVFT